MTACRASAARPGGSVRRRRTVRYGAPVRQRPPWLAPVRGVLLASLATLLTAVGHVAGGGSLEQLSPLAVLVPMLATVLVAVAERCRGVVAVLAALGVGQAVLHYLLVVLTTHGHGAAVPALSMVAAHAVATLAWPARCAGSCRAARGCAPSRSRCPRAPSPPRTSRSARPPASSPCTRGAALRSPAESPDTRTQHAVPGPAPG